MKDSDTLILAGAAVLGFFLLSQQKPVEAKEGGVSLPQFNFPDINFPETKAPIINLDIISETIGPGGNGGGGLDLSGIQKQLEDFFNQVKETVTGNGAAKANGGGNGKGIVETVADTAKAAQDAFTGAAVGAFIPYDPWEHIGQEWGINLYNPLKRGIRDFINMPRDLLTRIPGQNIFTPPEFIGGEFVDPKYHPQTYSQFIANREASIGIPEAPTKSEIELERETAIWTGYKEFGY